MLGSLTKFDRKELLSPSTLTPIFAAAESRPTGSKAAISEARGGDLGGAAITALAEGDQVLAMFLKGPSSIRRRNPIAPRCSSRIPMQLAPTAASRLFLGATLPRRRRTAQGGRRAAAERRHPGRRSPAKAAGSANPTSRASPARSGSRRANRSWPFPPRARRAVAYPRCTRAQAARGRLRARRPARRCRRGVHAGSTRIRPIRPLCWVRCSERISGTSMHRSPPRLRPTAPTWRSGRRPMPPPRVQPAARLRVGETRRGLK